MDREPPSSKVPVRLWAGMIASGLLCLALLGWQSGMFTSAVGWKVPPDTAALTEKVSWFGIYQDDRKIGFSRRQIRKTTDGFLLKDETLMRINTMGLVQDVEITTEGRLHSDMSLAAFDLRLASSRFAFHASGIVGSNSLDVTIDGRPLALEVQTPIYLTNTLMDTVAGSEMEPGETVRIPIFDPAAMARRPVLITFAGEETLQVASGTRETRRFTLEFLNTRQTAWVDAAGHVVKETGPLGLTLVAETREQALSGVSEDPGRDLTRLAAVPVNRKLTSPESLKELVIRVRGLPGGFDISGGRQSMDGNTIRIRHEAHTRVSDRRAPVAADLAATPLIQADHPEIADRASTVVNAADTPETKARELTGWVYRHLHKRPVISVPNAVEILHNRVGDCNEHAVLLAALGRAAGIPTRIEAGLVYMKGRFYYHAWNSFYVGRWITADAVFNQFPADVTHLRLVQGGLDRQIDLMGIIGKVSIDIVEATYD